VRHTQSTNTTQNHVLSPPTPFYYAAYCVILNLLLLHLKIMSSLLQTHSTTANPVYYCQPILLLPTQFTTANPFYYCQPSLLPSLRLPTQFTTGTWQSSCVRHVWRAAVMVSLYLAEPMGLLWHVIGLFWHTVGLFWHTVGLFWHTLASVMVSLYLAKPNLGPRLLTYNIRYACAYTGCTHMLVVPLYLAEPMDLDNLHIWWIMR